MELFEVEIDEGGYCLLLFVWILFDLCYYGLVVWEVVIEYFGKFLLFVGRVYGG